MPERSTPIYHDTKIIAGRPFVEISYSRMDQGGIEPLSRESAEVRQEPSLLVCCNFEASFPGITRVEVCADVPVPGGTFQPGCLRGQHLPPRPRHPPLNAPLQRVPYPDLDGVDACHLALFVQGFPDRET